jgi:hypothetical protein
VLGTRVCVFGHLSAVTNLLHDPIGFVTLGHDFDVRPDVLLARSDEEANSVTANLLVFPG